jgi:thioester reductase-like protein
LPTDQRRRVELVAGDAASIDFGLSGAELRKLATRITRIHHCAQVTYLGVDRAAAERVNVGGARELLEVAAACERLESLVFYSTASVSGDRTGVIKEDDLNKGQRFRNVVDETKARAEKIVRGAIGRLPVVIVRPSIVVGDSTTGQIDRMDGPYLLIVLILTSPPDLVLPLPGRGDVPLNLVPIDWVARSAVAIGDDPRAVGRCFHLVDPAPLSARRVFELVAQAAGRRGPRGSIPANLARALLRTPGLERFVKSPRGFIEALVTAVTYDARNTNEIVSDLDKQCPPLETYVDHLVDFAQMRLRERRARRVETDVQDPLG